MREMTIMVTVMMLIDMVAMEVIMVMEKQKRNTISKYQELKLNDGLWMSFIAIRKKENINLIGKSDKATKSILSILKILHMDL